MEPNETTNKRAEWEEVTKLMDTPRVKLGRYMSYLFQQTPRRVLYTMSYYKFAAKMIGPGKRVFDVGCSEGMGTWLLAKECGFARGVDSDEEAIITAQENWRTSDIEFFCEDFLEHAIGSWDAVVNFDVIEHIFPQNVEKFIARIAANLIPNGITVIGTPNLQSQQYASTVSRAGHVNIYDGERLEEELRSYFKHVFIFGANDEVVHTGFLPMAHYLIALACGIRDA